MEEELKKRFSCNVTRRFETFVESEVKSQNKITKIHLAYDSPFRFEPPVDSDLGIKLMIIRISLLTNSLLSLEGLIQGMLLICFFMLKTEDFWELTKLASQKDSQRRRGVLRSLPQG